MWFVSNPNHSKSTLNSAVPGAFWQVPLRILLVLSWLTYPFLVYVGLNNWGIQHTAFALIGWTCLTIILRVLIYKRADLSFLLVLGMAALALLSIKQQNHVYMLIWPVGINLVLLTTFALSLTSNRRSIAEYFAHRFGHHDLSDSEKKYCKSVTKAWIFFFALNTSIIVTLAIIGSLKAWTLYTGVLSYIAIGVFATYEYLLRKYKFRRYGTLFHDRLLARVFPPRIR
jgi:uncharacterized membrane protein